MDYSEEIHASGPTRSSSSAEKSDLGTFLANHASEIWACDFVQTYDLFFRAIFLFFIIEPGSRRVVHVNVTRSLVMPG